MSTENETWRDASSSEENSGAGRDGNQFNREGGYNRPSYNRENGDRPYRPRFNNENGDRPQRAYSSDRSYRPRFNPNGENGDRPQRSYGNNAGGDRPYRPRYNSEGGDRPQRSYGNNAGGDRLERIEVEEEDLATLNIKFPPAPRSGQIVAEIKEAGMSFGSKHVFSGANFTIERGDKIALVGRNGEGKTTLARMIVGQLTPTEGSIRVGANVNIGYYAQNQEDLMNGDFTVYDTLDRVAVGDVRTRLRDILGAFLFRGEDIDKKVKVLSGGERARLAMARLMLEPYNLLILDEPTNHMDMRSKDILKNAIMKYDGTVIVVSHDREFLDGMVSKVYEFRNGGVREYLGGIYYFLEKRKLESLQEVERKDAPAKEAAPKASSSGKLTYEQKKEQEKLLRKLRKAVETIEASLADLEKKIADYDRKFAEATQYNEADYKAYNELKAEYDHQMHEWEKASYELEITEGE